MEVPETEEASSHAAGVPVNRVVGAVAFSAVLLASVLASWIAGLDVVYPLVLALLPWILVLWNRFGALASFAVTVLGAFGGILLGMVVTAALGVPLVIGFCVVALGVGVTGAWRAARLLGLGPSLVRRVQTVSGPAVGALLWIVVVAASKVLPGGSAYGWVMNGDSANNLRFARADVVIAGIQLGGSENPVPLPAGLLALAMSAGRSSVSPALLLRHDLGEFVAVWAGVIAIFCIAVGAVVSSAIPASQPRIRWAVGALGSVLPMTWLVLGYPIEYGFFNTHIAIVVVLCSWLVFRMSSTRPAIAWAGLTLASTLLLTVWSPLVLLPISLMLTIFLRGPRALWRSSMVGRVLAIVGTAQLALFGLIVTLPTLFVQGKFLGMGGAAYPFSKIVLPALAVAAVVLAVAARRRIGALQMQGLIAAVVAFGLAYAVLGFAARGSADPLLSYYPAKMMWVALIVILVIGLALALGLMASWRLRAATIIAIAGLVVATVTFVQTAPINKTQYPLTNPIKHMLRGDLYGPGDRAARTILQFADPARPTILWKSGQSEEAGVNFWVLQMQAAYGPSGLGLRKAGYGEYDVNKPADLCKIVRQIGEPTRVITADTSLARALASDCPTLDIDVAPVSQLP
jgi:hypothetical protein